jgi:hypothetical protein
MTNTQTTPNIDLENRKAKLKSWLTVYLSITGMVGLVIAGATGFVVVSFAPWFALKVSNAKYRAIEAENISHIHKVTAQAAQNPIETMFNLLKQKRNAFEVFESNVVNAATARDTFKTKCDNFSKRYPARAPEFQLQLANMFKMVETKKRALQDAKKSLELGDMKLEEMKAYWEMSKDVQELNKAAGMDTGDAFEKLKSDTACDAVFESMNRAFAELEVAASLEVPTNDSVMHHQNLQNDAPTQIGHDATQALMGVATIEAVNIPETIQRSAR